MNELVWVPLRRRHETMIAELARAARDGATPDVLAARGAMIRAIGAVMEFVRSGYATAAPLARVDLLDIEQMFNRMAAGLADLEDGNVAPLLAPTPAYNRPVIRSDVVAARAQVGAAIEVLILARWKKNDAAREIVRIVAPLGLFKGSKASPHSVALKWRERARACRMSWAVSKGMPRGGGSGPIFKFLVAEAVKAADASPDRKAALEALARSLVADGLGMSPGLT